MSEPTLYRINDDKMKIATAANLVNRLLGWRVLVPVERCEHRNVFRHPVCVVYDSPIAHPTGRMTWCPGAGIGGDDE